MGEVVIQLFRKKYLQLEAMRILLYYSRLVTSSVFQEVNGKWSMCPRMMAINIFMTLASLFSFYPFLCHLWKGGIDLSFFHSFTLFKMILFSFWKLASVFSQLSHVQEAQEIVDSFRITQEMLSRIGTRRLVFSCPPLIHLMFNLTAVIVAGLLEIAIKFPDCVSKISMFFQTTWLAFVMQMDVFSVCVYLYSVRISMSYLNKCLMNWKCVDCKGNCLLPEEAEICCRVYHELCCQTDRLDSSYGLQLLIVFLICFTLMVDQLYVLVSTVFSDLQTSCVIISSALLKCSFAFFVIMSITKACDTTVSKAREFNMLLYQIMICDVTNTFSKNNKLRLHISMDKKVSFSAHGFFNIDYKLLHSVIAAATTYLVILVQFGNQPSFNLSVTKPKTNDTNILRGF